MWNHQPVTFGYSLNLLEEHIPHMVSGMEILGQFCPTNRGHRCPQKKTKKYRTVDTPIFPKKYGGRESSGEYHGISMNLYEYLMSQSSYFQNFPDVSACFSHQNIAIPRPFPCHSQAPWGPLPQETSWKSLMAWPTPWDLWASPWCRAFRPTSRSWEDHGISWKFGCDWDVFLGCVMI